VKSVDLMSLWNAVCSVLLCKSVRNRTHPLDKIRLMQVAGEFFLSTWGVLFSHRAHRVHGAFGTHFEPTERLRHTEVTEAFQLTLAVTFCEIG